MRIFWQKISLGLTALLFTFVMPASAEDQKIHKPVKIMCGNVGRELSFCQAGAKAWAEKTGNQVEVVPAVNGSNERLALYSQFMAAKSSDIDVFQIDVTWPSILEPHLEDLTPYVSPEQQKEFLPVLIENNTVNGKLMALPWFAETGILYYRKDLLDKYKKPVPTTWQELFKTAAAIQAAERAAGNPNMWGMVFQGRAYEGLSVNTLEWLKSAGVHFFDPNGNVTVNTSQAKDILNLFADNMGKTIPTGVLNYNEEETRGAFQSGNAVFMRNWPYAYMLAEADDSPLKGKVGLALLPKGNEGGRHTGALGGWQLAISKYSENKELAADLVKYLTGYEEQRRRAMKGGYTPSRLALHRDPEVAGNTTYLKFFGGRLDHMVARPSRAAGRKYSQVTSNIWNTVHSILSQGGKADIDKQLDALAKKLSVLVPPHQAHGTGANEG